MRHVSLSVWIWLGSLSVLCASASCSDNAAEQVPRKTGRLEVALTATSSSGVQYRLRNGTFRITGTSTKTLSSDAQPDAPALTAELTAGGYSLELVTGWSLQKRTASGSFESVKAALSSANPVAFTIVDQQTTSVLFRFKVGNDVVQFGNGRLTVQVEVDDCQPDAGDACAANAGGAGGAANDAGGSGGADAGGTTNEDGSTPDSSAGGTGGTNPDGGLGDAGAPSEDGGTSCFVDNQCADNGYCVGGQVQNICILSREQCMSHTDCKRSEYCDGAGHCVTAAGLDEPCSPGNRCGRGPNGQLWCDGSTNRCIFVDPHLCQQDEQCEEGQVCKQLSEGKACGDPTTYENQRCNDPNGFGLDSCADGLWCTSVREQPFPVCLRRQPLGAACQVDDLSGFPSPPCAAGLFCQRDIGSDASSGAGWCRESPGDGRPCVNPCDPRKGCGSPCAADHYCGELNFCRKYATLGEDCDSRILCAPDLECTGICVRPKEHGESCNSEPCAPGLRCVVGHAGGSCEPCRVGYVLNEENRCVGLPFTAVSAGRQQNCGLRTNGAVSCWGIGQDSQPGQNFTAIVAGVNHACGVLQNQSVVCWNDDSDGQISSVPSGAFTAISGHGYHLCGLRPDGTVTCWGANSRGQATPPAETFVAIDASYTNTCGLKQDGHVTCWGANDNGQSAVPANQTFTAVSVGYMHTCALRADGTALCWGDNFFGQSSPPSGQAFVAISAGNEHTCALKNDGSAQCWGQNYYGESSPPKGQKFVSISAGLGHTCGLKQDGSILCWGAGESAPPQ